MTACAQLVLEAISNGWRLRMPHAAGEPITLEFPRRFISPIGPLDPYVVAEVIDSGRLQRIRREMMSGRPGWRELGLDGERATFFRKSQ